MAITSGFFNSVSGDRRYNAEDFGRIFRGIITDGVFKGWGNKFYAQANNTRNIVVQSGRAWFWDTWIENDGNHTIVMDAADLLKPRWDVICFFVDKSSRTAGIRTKKGTAVDNPQKPTLLNNPTQREWALAYVYRATNDNTIIQSDVQSQVGMDATPWITAPLETLDMRAYISSIESAYFTERDRQNNDFLTFNSAKRSEFDSWWNQVKGVISTNAPLQASYTDLNAKYTTLVRDGGAHEDVWYDKAGSSINPRLEDDSGNSIEYFMKLQCSCQKEGM